MRAVDESQRQRNLIRAACEDRPHVVAVLAEDFADEVPGVRAIGQFKGFFGASGLNPKLRGILHVNGHGLIQMMIKISVKKSASLCFDQAPCFHKNPQLRHRRGLRAVGY